jgi:hypothetical protein
MVSSSKETYTTVSIEGCLYVRGKNAMIYSAIKNFGWDKKICGNSGNPEVPPR